MKGTKVLIFANPIAGRGRGRTVATQLEQSLKRAGLTPEIFLQRPAEIPIDEIDPLALAAISIGGDGSLRAVVETLLRRSEKEIPPLLLLPLGTANLMARHLGLRWPRNPAAALLATLKARNITHIDAARANGKVFLLMAGVGFDAHVVHLLDQMRTGPIDVLSYLLPTARTLAEYPFPAITLTVDDRIIVTNRPAIVFIGNVKEYGIGFPILTQARSDDGLLDICVMPCRDHRDLAEMLMMVVSGEHPLRDDVIYLRGKSIHVEGPSEVPIQLDGDSAGHTPMRIEMLPVQIPFLLHPPALGFGGNRPN